MANYTKKALSSSIHKIKTCIKKGTLNLNVSAKYKSMPTKRSFSEQQNHEKYIKMFFKTRDPKILHCAILDNNVKSATKTKIWHILIDNTENDEIKIEYILASGIRTNEMIKKLLKLKPNIETVKHLFFNEKIRIYDIFLYIFDTFLVNDVTVINGTNHENTSVEYHCSMDDKQNKINGEKCHNQHNNNHDVVHAHVDDFMDLVIKGFLKLKPKHILHILANSKKIVRLPQFIIDKKLIQSIDVPRGSVLPEYVKHLCLQCNNNVDLVHECYNVVKKCKLDLSFVQEMFCIKDCHVQFMKIKETIKIYFRTVIRNKNHIIDRAEKQLLLSMETITDDSVPCFCIYLLSLKIDKDDGKKQSVSLNYIKKSISSFINRFTRDRSLHKNLLYNLHFMNEDYVNALQVVKNEKSERKIVCLAKISKKCALMKFDNKMLDNKKFELLKLRLVNDYTANKTKQKNNDIDVNVCGRNTKGQTTKNNTYIATINDVCTMINLDNDDTNLFYLRYLKEQGNFEKFEQFYSKIKATEAICYEKFVFYKRMNKHTNALHMLKDITSKTSNRFLEFEYLFASGKLHHIIQLEAKSTILCYYKIKEIISNAHADWQYQALTILAENWHKNGDFFIFYFYILQSMRVRYLCSKTNEQCMIDMKPLLIQFFENLYCYILTNNWKGYYFKQMMDYFDDDIQKKLEFGITLVKKDDIFWKNKFK